MKTMSKASMQSPSQSIPLMREDESSFPFSLLYAQCTDVMASPNDHYQRLSFPYTNFELVMEGEGYLKVEGRTYHLRSGDLFTLPQGQAHEYWPHPERPWRKFFVTFGGSMLASLLKSYGWQGFRAVHAPFAEKYFVKWQDLKSQPNVHKHAKASIWMQEMLLELSEKITSETKTLSLSVSRMKALLEEHLEKKVQLKELCQQLRLNERVISRQFKAELGVTPYGYLLEQRYQLSMFLLAYSELNVSEVAERLTFADIYSFSSFFKKKNGRSPKAYLRSQALKDGGLEPSL